jgi:hypothetical protein
MSGVWPSWLTSEQLSQLRDLGAARFTWTTGAGPADSAPELRGQWARELTEIDVCLSRDYPEVCVVGVYPRGEGFFRSGREPTRDGSHMFATGTVDEVVQLADDWARAREY